MNKLSLLLLPIALAFATPGLAQNQFTSDERFNPLDWFSPYEDPGSWQYLTAISGIITWNYSWSDGGLTRKSDTTGFANGFSWSMSSTDLGNGKARIDLSWVDPNGTSGRTKSFVVDKNQPDKIFDLNGNELDPKTGQRKDTPAQIAANKAASNMKGVISVDGGVVYTKADDGNGYSYDYNTGQIGYGFLYTQGNGKVTLGEMKVIEYITDRTGSEPPKQPPPPPKKEPGKDDTDKKKKE